MTIYHCTSLVDTAAYHAELAFNKQVKEQNLVELLASNNNLVMGKTIGLDWLTVACYKLTLTLYDIDIKELDGNVKSLVYRNYSKFLAATDTIRKVRSRQR